jgi:TRAP transporter TAXI family solute receptor
MMKLLKSSKNCKCITLLLFAALMSVSSFSTEPKTHVSIATGNETGVYFPAGGAICRLVNKTRKENGFRCYVESTEGSAYNLRALREGTVDFAVVQSDWQYHAYYGSSIFESDGPHRQLRSVLALHPEAFTVVASSASGIKNFADLKGKRVNVGSKGSGQRGTMEVLLKAYGWSLNDFSVASEIKAIEQPRALCSGDIDVMLYIVGHPSGAVKEVTTLCDSRLVEVKGPIIDSLINNNSYYRRALIPAGMYRNNPEAVETFGVGATFVTVSSMPDDIVYTIVKAVFENFDQFKKLHPALANLQKNQMVFDSLTAPLHPGAKRYYKEAGILSN